MFESIVRHSYVILPIGLLVILAGGTYGWHAKLVEAHRARQMSDCADISSRRQMNKDIRRARVVPDIHILRFVADTLAHDAKWYGDVIDTHSGRSEAEMARQNLITARSHADAQLRHQHWWIHLTAPS